MKKYRVDFKVSGTGYIIVEADDEDKAEELARKRMNDDFDVDHARLEETWSVEEVD